MQSPQQYIAPTPARRNRLLMLVVALGVVLIGGALLLATVWPGASAGGRSGGGAAAVVAGGTSVAGQQGGSAPVRGNTATPVPPTRVLPTSTPAPTLTPFAGDPVASVAQPAAMPSGSRYFTETGHLVPAAFLAFYNSHDGADLFGLPLTEQFAQKLPDGHVYMVQYFEGARLEAHTELPVGQRVQLGALTPAVLGGRTFERVAAASDKSVRYFPETGHTLGGGFLEYWTDNGGLAVFGMPLSEEIAEDGLTVQYFERARFEYRAEQVGTPYAIQLSPLGYMALKAGGFNLPMGTLVRINPPTLAEGHTATVEVAASAGVTVTGQYEGRPLLFTLDAQRGTAWAMLGAVPFQDLGEHTITLSLANADGGRRTVTRTLEITSYPFPQESLQFDPATSQLLGPQQQQEVDTLAAIFAGRTPEKYWDGHFRMPLNGTINITSYFGTRRCYGCPAGAASTTYHAGMDMSAAVGTPVHAPAAGRIVFAGQLAERGNAIIIDHGMGVYSLLAHNSKFVAQVGDFVQQGDVISLSGNTGLSNGPHLHWELHVSGPPVEPREWVNRAMP